ncbi:MAG: glycoside hydrolase family 2 [Spirochaetaceae bacterium]
MKPRHLNTPWSKTINRELPLNEYPRPELLRDRWLNLNGIWDYAVIDKTINNISLKDGINWEGDILVPFAIETELSGVTKPLKPGQSLWYRRSVTVPESWSGEKIVLNFEAVDWFCICYVNGVKVGEHKGGYIPFCFDITDKLNSKDNQIILAVEDSTDNGFQQRGKQVLNPTGIYYEATSGIWQTVWLEPIPVDNSIISIKITPNIDTNLVELTTTTIIDTKLRVTITEGDKTIKTTECKSNTMYKLPFEDYKLWSPQTPILYGIKIEIISNKSSPDFVDSYFGMRKISSEICKNGHKRVLLNNKPIFLHGPLDQGYWPESGMTPLCEEAILFDIEKTIELGFNMTRKHIKIEPRRWYYHADRLGLLVIQDAVSGGSEWTKNPILFASIIAGVKFNDSTKKAHKRTLRNTKESREDFENELHSMMEHLHNHPSIIIWVPFNEAWGQYDSVRITKEIGAKDPTRLIDHASGWIDQGVGDFSSIHTYTFALKNKKKREDRIYFLSEYGGYNLNVPGHMWNENKKYGYKSFKDKNSLEKAYINLIEDQLIPKIKNGLSVAVYTQLTDVEIESNGYFSYDRKVQKIDTNVVRSLNQKIYNEFLLRTEK